MLPWALDRHVRMPAAHTAPDGLEPPVAPGGSSFARCHPRPRAVVRQGSRLVWLREDRCVVHATRRSRAAGPVRWQPEDCCAAGPPAPAREGEPGSARFDDAHPEGRSPSALRRDPGGQAPKVPSRTPEEDPEGASPVAGPLHPKVPGLRLSRPFRRTSRPQGRRCATAASPSSSKPRGPRRAGTRRCCRGGPRTARSSIRARCPKAGAEPTRHSCCTPDGLQHSNRARLPRRRTEQASPSARHPKVVRFRTHGSGRSPAS
jgi:hypothetical protein